MARISNAEAVAHLRDILSHQGIRAAVIFLNGLTNHRFTSLYRFTGDRLKNLFFFDRAHPDVGHSEDIPIAASYCVFVRNSGKLYCSEDSLHDERVVNQPKRQQVQSYCGVPLLDADGKMFGTICHFDTDPKPIAEEDVDLLDAMARLLNENKFL